MSTVISTLTDDGILHIEFNRPEKKNAITVDMYAQASEAFEQANTNPKVRVIIISGRGDSFTAGNDLMDFISHTSDGLNNGVVRFLNAVPNCTKPIIAAVQGHAVGIGTTLLLHCDMVYADTTAKFQLPFVKLALCPEFGSSFLLPRLIGQRHAAALLYTGAAINAETAFQYGLINQVTDDALATAREQAQIIAALPAAAIRLTKDLLTNTDKAQLMSIIEAEGKEFAECMKSPEAKEAMTAFMEKRQPDFSQFD
ncbi:enoyl-CoA hydratase [Oceanicoccus sp. KOV_DT_Chl]|uniref:enoyl-CoA hydratase n=1 Tax=Oceanicoccus sp. KOV_DT_Chl TaxID=1904639 RepID=UPI000C7C58C6|nr:enoyl-CoA hydratase [Oceanicoccus sp. KOV_DT_Chl]